MQKKILVKDILYNKSLTFITNVYRGYYDMYIAFHDITIDVLENPKTDVYLPKPKVLRVKCNKCGEITTLYCYTIPVSDKLTKQFPDVEVDLKNNLVYLSMLDKDNDTIFFNVLQFSNNLKLSNYFNKSYFAVDNSNCIDIAKLAYGYHLQDLHILENDWKFDEVD